MREGGTPYPDQATALYDGIDSAVYLQLATASSAAAVGTAGRNPALAATATNLDVSSSGQDHRLISDETHVRIVLHPPLRGLYNENNC